jgi:hypothetical protein
MLDTTALADAGSGVAASSMPFRRKYHRALYFRFNWTTRQTG